MKLWQKTSAIHPEVEKFTVGNDKELDMKIASWDVIASMAHAVMLQECDLLTQTELKHLLQELRVIYSDIKLGKFVIEPGMEDVHSQIEFILTQNLGETGKKIHTARSRNDQVLTAIKLYFRSEILTIVEKTGELFYTLIKLSEKNKAWLLPGYTHMQVAMPSSFGMWLGAYAESLTDDLEVMHGAYQVINKNPMGSAAGYGTSFKINRTLTTQLLGFADLNYNSVYAQMTRGKSEKALAGGVAAIASTINKLAVDICLYMGQDFGFISFPEELTTGSSIMPHKKNPDVFELLRAKTNRLQALPNELMLMTTNMPSGYHRDWQLLKNVMFPALDELKSCISMINFMLPKMMVNEQAVFQDKYKYAFSVEKVNELVMQGMAFRDAYKEVGKRIDENTYQADYNLQHTHEGSIGNLCNEKIVKQMEVTLGKFDDTYIKAKMMFLVEEAVSAM